MQRILKLHTPDGTEPPTFGRDWTKRFLKRNPTVYKVKQKPIEIDWAAANDPAVIQEWYTLYRNTKEQWGILPCDKYNFDESGFRIKIGSSQWIITRVSDTKKMYLASETNRDFTSVLEAISSDGVVFAPAVIIKGQQIMH